MIQVENFKKLTYFHVRFIFSEGIPYDDIRVGPEFTTFDKEEGTKSGKYAFGQLPCLVTPGPTELYISQT